MEKTLHYYGRQLQYFIFSLKRSRRGMVIGLFGAAIVHVAVLSYFYSDRANEEMVCYAKGQPPTSELNIELSNLAEQLKNPPGENGDMPGAKPEKQNEGKGKNDQKLADTFNENQGQFPHEQKHNELVKRLQHNYKIEKKYSNQFDNLMPKGTRPPDSYVYRKRKYYDIVVKEVLPSLKNIDRPFNELIKDAPEILDTYEERNDVIDKYEAWKEGKPLLENKPDIKIDLEENNEKLGVLKWPKSERQAFLDKTLPLLKEDQYQYFINKYVQGNDPDEGDLPLAIRDMYYQNIQRLAYQFSFDQTYFAIDYFQENLNKEDYLHRSLDLVSQLNKSKSATEILFTLENIYEIQERAISYMLKMAKQMKGFPPEKYGELRYQVISRVVKRYMPLLAQKGILTSEDSARMYLKRQEEVIDYILETTPNGYRRSDALFEKGRINWEKATRLRKPELRKKAAQIWSQIPLTKDSDFLNYEPLSKIRPLLGNINSTNPYISQTAANQITYQLARRLTDSLNEKKERENRLLWKEGKPSS